MAKVRVKQEPSASISEKRNLLQCTNLEVKNSEWKLVDKFSSLSKLLRISIYIFRFLKRLVTKPSVNFEFNGILTTLLNLITINLK